MPDTAETAHIKAPRSMAHLLRTTLMAVGILSLLLSVVGAALLFQHAFAEQFDTDLSRTVEAIAVGYEHSADPQPEQLAQYADGLRLTLWPRMAPFCTILPLLIPAPCPTMPTAQRSSRLWQRALVPACAAVQPLGTTPIIMPCA
mgnify:CR=1 FL=1